MLRSRRSEEIKARKVVSLQALCITIINERFELSDRYYWCRRVSCNKEASTGYSPSPELMALDRAGILERKTVGPYQPLGKKFPANWFRHGNTSVYVYGEAQTERLKELAQNREAASAFLSSAPVLPITTTFEEALEMVRAGIEKDANPRKKFLEVVGHLMPEFK